MRLQKRTIGKKVKITFIPETKEEKLIMGSLRNHYFFGDDDDGTFPAYAGIDSEDNYVTAMHFTYYKFK